jgi:CAAX protease family protein
MQRSLSHGQTMTTDASIDVISPPAVPAGFAGIWRLPQDWGREFINQAALGLNRPRSYIFSALRIVLWYFGFAALVIGWVMLEHRRTLPPAAMIIAAFGSVIAAGAAVARSAARTHRRPWLSLITPSLKLDWRRLKIGVGVQAFLAGSLLVTEHLVTGEPWRLPFTDFPVVVLALALTPLQAASEELLFRGYMTQALGRLFKSRIAIMGAVSVTFAALHCNVYGPLTMPYMIVVSLIFSLVSLRDGRLELVIGAHIAENWMSIGGIDAMAYRLPDVQITWPYVPALLVQGLLFYGATRWLVQRFERRADQP